MKLLALLAPCAALASQLELELRANGSYALRLDGATWLESGATFFTAGGATFSTADGSLALEGGAAPARSAGADALGAFNRTALTWSLGGSGATVVTAFQEYGDVVVFEQLFPAGLNGTSVDAADPASAKASLASAFPSFACGAADASGVPKGFVAWGGRFMEASRAGAWEACDLPAGEYSGPFALFDEARTGALMVSALSNFATASTSPLLKSSPSPTGGSGGGSVAFRRAR